MTRRTRAEMIESTRAKLISAARKAFANQGFTNTSMDDLTAAVGLTRGALYHHFGNKEGLLLAVIEQMDAEISERLKVVSDTAPSIWEGFRLRCRSYLELALEPEIRRIMMQDSRAVFGDMPQTVQSASILKLQASLDELVAESTVVPLDTYVTARMIDGAITEACFWIAELEGDQALRLEQALKTLDYFLSGLLIK